MKDGVRPVRSQLSNEDKDLIAQLKQERAKLFDQYRLLSDVHIAEKFDTSVYLIKQIPAVRW